MEPQNMWEWLISRIGVVTDGAIQLDNLYEHYKYEAIDANMEVLDMKHFAQHLLSVFPDIKTRRIRVGEKRTRKYEGITLKPLESALTQPCGNICNITVFLPSHFIVKNIYQNWLICEFTTAYTSNGCSLSKLVTFLQNYHWTLDIAGKNIDLLSLNIDDTYSVNKESILVVCDTVEKIKICQGVEVKKTVTCSKFQILESWKCTTYHTKPMEKRLRSILCKRAVSFLSSVNTCRVCQNMKMVDSQKLKKRSDTSEKTEIVLPEKPSNSKVTKGDFKKLIPNAKNEMLELFVCPTQNSEHSKAVVSQTTESEQNTTTDTQTNPATDTQTNQVTDAQLNPPIDTRTVPATDTLFELESMPGTSASSSDQGHIQYLESDSDYDDYCKICLKVEGVQWIQCENCNCWMHRKCAGLTNTLKWKRYSKKGVKFYCKEC